ncbi:MAG: glutamate--tRNA ligase family protein, partial [Proteobacteria bacterium]|nr:glutamate--tRNA ligase family protein [Pseudomonadota bacterium]
LYPCCCSRKDVGNAPYNGKCRNGMDDPQKATSIRIRVNQQEINFNDQIQGQYSQQLDTAVGDFIIKRADHMTSYNLAVVIDDADQGITEIVRGTDLIDTTPRQIYLQNILEFQQPSYMHFPIVVNEAGNKLSKQNHAPEVNSKDSNKMFFSVLDFLGQSPPDELRTANLDDIIKWAINNWDIKSIAKAEKIFYEY